jgi:hypothetical protein
LWRVAADGREPERVQRRDQPVLEPAHDVDRTTLVHAHDQVADELPGSVVRREATPVNGDRQYAKVVGDVGRIGTRPVRDHRWMAEQEEPVTGLTGAPLFPPAVHPRHRVVVLDLAEIDPFDHNGNSSLAQQANRASAQSAWS